MRFLFPKSLVNFGKNFPAVQFRCVLAHRCGGLVVQRCPMAEDDQCGVREVFALHAGIFAGSAAACKPANAIFYETF